jgi:5-dehydro-4-deoxyglucarate dehydratase
VLRYGRVLLAGLLAHYRQVADRSRLDLIVYQRNNAVFSSDTVAELATHPRVVGFKDGRGDLDLMRRIVGAARWSTSTACRRPR